MFQCLRLFRKLKFEHWAMDETHYGGDRRKMREQLRREIGARLSPARERPKSPNEHDDRFFDSPKTGYTATFDPKSPPPPIMSPVATGMRLLPIDVEGPASSVAAVASWPPLRRGTSWGRAGA